MMIRTGSRPVTVIHRAEVMTYWGAVYTYTIAHESGEYRLLEGSRGLVWARNYRLLRRELAKLLRHARAFGRLASTYDLGRAGYRPALSTVVLALLGLRQGEEVA